MIYGLPRAAPLGGRLLRKRSSGRLLKAAVIRHEWETAYLAAILCQNTTARGCELKGLQWCDVDLFARTLTIRKSKTAAGERAVALTDVAVSAREGAEADLLNVSLQFSFSPGIEEYRVGCGSSGGDECKRFYTSTIGRLRKDQGECIVHISPHKGRLPANLPSPLWFPRRI